MMWNALSQVEPRHAIDPPLAHPCDHPFHMGDRRLRQDAVAEIEDERSVAESRQDRIDLAIERSAAREQCQRIEIALHRPAALDLVAGKAAIDHPVEPDRVDSNAVHIALNSVPAPRGNPMIFASGTRCAQPRDDPPRRIDAPARELVGSEHAGPGVEELHGIDPGLELGREIIDRSFDQDVDQLAEDFRIAIGKQPRRRLVRRAVSRHHVGRDRPWRAAKAEQRHFARQLGANDPDRLEHRRQALRDRSRLGNGLQAVATDDRCKPRPFAGRKRHLLPERMRHDQNVREQNRRIEAEPPDRLQRHLGGKLRSEAEIEEAAGLLAQLRDTPADSARPAASSRSVAAGDARRREPSRIDLFSTDVIKWPTSITILRF